MSIYNNFKYLSIVSLALGGMAAPTQASDTQSSFDEFNQRIAAHQNQQMSLCMDYLDSVSLKVKAANDGEQKERLVTLPINAEYLISLSSTDELHEGLLTHAVGNDPFFYLTNDGEERFNYNKSTPLTLAVSTSRADLVEAWLPLIPDVNALHLTGWGYRQPYTLAHHAVEPIYPVGGKVRDMGEALKVMDLLAARGGDFQAYIKYEGTGIYDGQPLGAGTHRAESLDPLTIRALLYGADPKAQGTSGHDTNWRLQKKTYEDGFCDEAFVTALYKDAKELVKQGVPITPMQNVILVLEAKQIEETQALLKKVLPISGLSKEQREYQTKLMNEIGFLYSLNFKK